MKMIDRTKKYISSLKKIIQIVIYHSDYHPALRDTVQKQPIPIPFEYLYRHRERIGTSGKKKMAAKVIFGTRRIRKRAFGVGRGGNALTGSGNYSGRKTNERGFQ